MPELDKNHRLPPARLTAAIVGSILAFGTFLSGSITCIGQTTNASIAFSEAIYYAEEDTGAGKITVTRTGNTNTAVTVSYATGKSLGIPGVDYTPQSGTLSFAAGETSKSFSIPIMDDDLSTEGSEPVELTLSNPTGGAVLGAQATARMYIQDNENRGTLVDYAFNGAMQADDSVFALAAQSDGKFLVAGSFARTNSTIPHRVIRVNPDGGRDAGFALSSGGPTNSVYALAVQGDGKILIGGAFTNVGAVARNRLARLNADGSSDLTFDPGLGINGSVSPAVYTITLQRDGKMLLGGNFDSVNGVFRTDVARLNVNGSLDTTFQPGAGVNSTDASFRVPWVSAVVVQTDGKVLIGGQFTEVDGLSRLNIARLNADGTVDATFDPGLGAAGRGASVEAIALQTDGKVVIGGNFTKVNDVNRSAIARLNSNGSLDLSFDPGSGVKDLDTSGADIAGLVTSLAMQPDGKILLAGYFRTIDEINRHGLARLNSDGTVDGTFGPYFGTTYRNSLGNEELETATAMALQADGKVVIAGNFYSVDGSQTNRLTRLLSTNVRTSSFEFTSPGVSTGETNGTVSITVIRRGDSGEAFTLEFATTGGTASPGTDFIAQNGTLRFGPLETKKTIDLPILSDSISEDDETVNVILRNPSAGSILGSPTNFAVRIIDRQKAGNLDFGFAAVDIPIAGDPTQNLPVNALVVQSDKKVLIAGSFASVNGTNLAGMVRLNADGTIDPSFVPQPPAGAQSLDVQQMGLQPDGHIIYASDGVARLNPDGSRDTRFDPGVSSVTALTVQKDGQFLVADEFFDRAADTFQDEVLRFSADGVVDSSFSSPVLDDWVYAISVQPDAKVVIGGFFTHANGEPQNRIARLNVDGSLDTSFNVGAGLQGSTNSGVYALALAADGKVIVGGNFTRANNVVHNFLVRLNANGSVDTSFDPGTGPDNFIAAVAVQTDGKVLIAGGFSSINGVPRIALARLNSDGRLDTSFEPKLRFAGPVLVSSMALQPDGQILIAGLFTAINGMPRFGIARLNGDGSSTILRLEPIWRGPSSPFRLALNAQPGQRYRLDASADLKNWSPISTNTAVSSTLEIDDPTVPAPALRFYRAAVSDQ